MSHTLDSILAMAEDYPGETATLSGLSVVVLFYAIGFIQQRKNWIDNTAGIGDSISDEEWQQIQDLVENLTDEVINPLPVFTIGQVNMFGMDTLPDNWLPCDGTTRAIADFPDLFAAIGNAWNAGTSISPNFRLPDLGNKSPMGESGGNDVGEFAGSGAVALTTAMLPAHNHVMRANAPGLPIVNLKVGTATTGANFAPTGYATNGTTDMTTANAGSGTDVPILHPVAFLRFGIYAGIV